MGFHTSRNTSTLHRKAAAVFGQVLVGKPNKIPFWIEILFPTLNTGCHAKILLRITRTSSEEEGEVYWSGYLVLTNVYSQPGASYHTFTAWSDGPRHGLFSRAYQSDAARRTRRAQIINENFIPLNKLFMVLVQDDIRA